jgi:AcrR family transcriptional regulator
LDSGRNGRAGVIIVPTGKFMPVDKRRQGVYCINGYKIHVAGILYASPAKVVSMARGRPRTFNFDEALDRALDVFWRKGYEGATLPDLTEAMGINRPSLYAAFGNKEELFRKALERYAEGPAAFVRHALSEPTARKVAESLLFGEIDLLCNPKTPRGCFAVQAALACGDEAECVREELCARRKSLELAIRRRFQKARNERDLPATADPAALAGFLATVTHGLAVQAAGGATRRELKRVAKMALAAWPE